ncbi:unnamed protein product [Mycena citricolor]|uniref:Uncharacterized protein n=1 Tax=Mycena citricolor TaxID=2018698 RepID=A0AAD2Q6K9_9AGAR|nr:unnamed protein product [Mycena citricolor]
MRCRNRTRARGRTQSSSNPRSTLSQRPTSRRHPPPGSESSDGVATAHLRSGIASLGGRTIPGEWLMPGWTWASFGLLDPGDINLDSLSMLMRRPRQRRRRPARRRSSRELAA